MTYFLLYTLLRKESFRIIKIFDKGQNVCMFSIIKFNIYKYLNIPTPRIKFCYLNICGFILYYLEYCSYENY